MKEIAIITGGDSAEYAISIQSADVVLKNLDTTKYVGTIVHIKDKKWTAIINGSHHRINKEDFSIKAKNFAMNNDWDHITRQIIDIYQDVFDDYNVRSG